MKQQLPEFARDVDAFCARLNGGLAAFAILLGLLVMIMSVVRAHDSTPEFSASVPAAYETPLGY